MVSLRWPVEPMRAVGAAELPAPSAARAVVYEPKWDGFRALVWAAGDGVRLQSRQGRDLTRFFPDLCQAVAGQLAPGLVLDGEIVVWDERLGRTSFGLLQRRFTAGRRLPAVAAEYQAHFVAFDVLRDARRRDVLEQPLYRRRSRLRRLLASAPPQLAVCPQTSDERTARSWVADWTAAGIEGLLVKPRESTYRPGEGGWVKVRTRHTADYIIAGMTGSYDRPDSLLLGRYDQHGVLRFAGQTHRVRAERRGELARLRTIPFRGDATAHPWPCPLPAGWTVDYSDRRPLPYLQIEPTSVAEVEADTAVDGPFDRLRHRCRLVRLRPDLHPHDVQILNSPSPSRPTAPSRT